MSSSISALSIVTEAGWVTALPCFVVTDGPMPGVVSFCATGQDSSETVVYFSWIYPVEI